MAPHHTTQNHPHRAYAQLPPETRAEGPRLQPHAREPAGRADQDGGGRQRCVEGTHQWGLAMPDVVSSSSESSFFPFPPPSASPLRVVSAGAGGGRQRAGLLRRGEGGRCGGKAQVTWVNQWYERGGGLAAFSLTRRSQPGKQKGGARRVSALSSSFLPSYLSLAPITFCFLSVFSFGLVLPAAFSERNDDNWQNT